MSLTVARWQAYAPYKVSMGGINPHLTIAAEAAKAWVPDKYDRAWFIGCWCGPYVVHTGVQIYKHFPDFHDVLFDDAPGGRKGRHLEFRQFLEDNWKGLPVRGSERRGVMSARKLGDYLVSYAHWLTHVNLYAATYDELYASARKHLANAGRFTTIKLLEALRLAEVIDVALPYGIQPRDGWSPRRALDELARDAGFDSALEHGSNREKLAEANRAAEWARGLLGDLEPRWWLLEGLLCGARQIEKGRYPGRAYDEDMLYAKRVGAYWNDDQAWYWDFRRLLFPEWILGELHGWEGVREAEIERWLNIR